MRAFPISIVVLSLAACQAAPPLPANTPSPPPPSTVLPPEAGFDGFNTPNLVTGKAYLPRSSSLADAAQAGRPVAFLILSDRKKKRGREACEAFERLAPLADAGATNPGAVQVPTYFMLNNEGVPAEKDPKDRCKKLVANYDFERGRQLAQDWQLPKTKATYLLALDGQGRSFFIDISKGKDAQLEEVMKAWFIAAASNPDSEGSVLKSSHWFTTILNRLPLCTGLRVLTDLVPYGKQGAGIILGENNKCFAANDA